MSGKKLIILLSVGFVSIFVVAVTLNQKSSKYGTLHVVAVPGDATALLNGKKIATNRDIGVTPGKYTLKVSRSGFESSEQSFIIETKKRDEVTAFLKANSDEGRQWQKENPDEMAEVESRASQAFDEASDAAVAKTPLIRYLPFTDLQYRISYGKSEIKPDDQSAVAIYVKYWTEEAKGDALDWMRFRGADPDKLEIIYVKGEGFN